MTEDKGSERNDPGEEGPMCLTGDARRHRHADCGE